MTHPTIIFLCGSVNLIHRLTSGLLMKAVDILCDNPCQLSFFLQMGQGIVGDIWFNGSGVKLLAVELIEHLRMGNQTVMT